MDGVTHRRGGTAGARRMTPSTRELTIREVLAEIGTSNIPMALRSSVLELDQSWSRSGQSKAWLVNECLKAGRPDLLAALLNKHGADRLTGIRDGAAHVADLLMACPSLVHVEFCRAPIGDDAARVLVIALRECQGLTGLVLRNCEMSNDALGTIADGLSEMHRLQTFGIKARSGVGLRELGAGIARSTLASLWLAVPDLTSDEAKKFGRSLQGNCTLTMLQLSADSSGVLTSVLEALGSALPRLAGMGLQAGVPFDDAFCKQLGSSIETHHVLASIRVRPGIEASEKSVARLCAAIDRHSVKIDFDARRVPKPLLEVSRVFPYRQLIVPEDAMRIAALALLRKSKLWRGLPGELALEIASTLVGNGSLRELWRLRGLMGVRKKKMREPAMLARSTLHCKRFATGWGCRDSPDRPDLDAFMHFWRLKLSAIELRESDALLLREWGPDSKTRSERSPQHHAFHGKLMEIGQQLVSEHLTLVGRWIDEGNDDAAAFALDSLQRLAREHGFDHEGKAGELNQRLTLGEVRYERRNACGNLARSMFWVMTSLLLADGVLDAVMRHLFDPDRGYGVGAPRPFEEARSQRGTAFYGMLGSILALYILMRYADQWVDATTRRLRLPQL